MTSRFTGIMVVMFCLGISAVAFSQTRQPAKDTTYYISYTNKITGRFYFSQKYTSLRYRNRVDDFKLVYRPNTSLNMGVGATYKWATLNLAYGFGFLNPDKDKGKTRYLDLQFHNYGRKFALDMAGQFYRGFYLNPQDVSPAQEGYYKRPDMKINEVGGTFQYIVNHRQFSYRSAFLMNEWQKRSAGSLLVGGEIYTGRIKADSTIVPGPINNESPGTDFDLFRYFEIGLNGGYAYTFVFDQHFFLSGSVVASLDYSARMLSYEGSRSRDYGFSPNTTVRLFGGYNSATWGVSLAYINSQVRLTNDDARNIALNTGNVRLNLIYRFIPSPSQRKILKVIK